MDGVKVTFELPAELVERAKAVGIDVENRPDFLIDGLERAIQKYEAVKRLDEIRTKLDALPHEMQLTQDEIDSELRAYYREKAAQKQDS